MNISRKLTLNLYEQVLRYKDQKDATPNHFTMPHCQRLTIALTPRERLSLTLIIKRKCQNVRMSIRLKTADGLKSF